MSSGGDLASGAAEEEEESQRDEETVQSGGEEKKEAEALDEDGDDDDNDDEEESDDEEEDEEEEGDGDGDELAPPRLDRYGFLVEDMRTQAAETDPEKLRLRKEKESERTKKWIKMMRRWNHYLKHKPKKVKRRIRKGIPDCARGWVWQQLLHVNAWKRKYPDLMSKPNNIPANVKDDIIKDLDRTYPRHEMFVDEEHGQASLKRLLFLYAGHDPEAGYCQGMAFIAGLFLMYMTEESAFYCLVAVCERPEFPLRLCYLPRFAELQMMMSVYGCLGRRLMPRIWARLDAENMHETMYVTEWFMTVFTRSFHFDFVTRVWDAFLHEGRKVIYRAALALIKSLEVELATANFERMMGLFRELPTNMNTERVLDIMWRIPLSHAMVHEEELKYKTLQARQQQQGSGRGGR